MCVWGKRGEKKLKRNQDPEKRVGPQISYEN